MSNGERKPLCTDLFCGLGGWSEGALAAGYEVVGFDIERHTANGKSYPAQLVLQDVLTIHGSQFRNAALLVASPPCQNYSYLAMPWSKSKPVPCEACEGNGSWLGIPCLACNQTGEIEHSKAAKALRKKWETEGPDNRLFDACFRIQREANESTCHCSCWRCRSGGHCVRCDNFGNTGIIARYIPLVVENVRGAQPWVGKRDMPLDQWLALSKEERYALGRSKAAFGSFHLWGDVAQVGRRIVAGAPEFGAGMRSGGMCVKQLHSRGDNQTCGQFRMGLGAEGFKANPDGTDHPQGSWFRIADSSHGDRGKNTKGNGTRTMPDGTKIGGDWFGDPNSTCRKHGSRSNARKQASAMIAVIPFDLAYYIACAFRPADVPAPSTPPAHRPVLPASSPPLPVFHSGF